MKRLFLALALMPFVALAQTTPPSELIRPYGVAMQDTMDAAHYVQKTVATSGMQTVITAIRDCYSTTELPAFRCIDLDIAAKLYDLHTGRSEGLPGNTEAFFNHSAFAERIHSGYPAGRYTDQQIQDDVNISSFYAEMGLAQKPEQP